MENGPIKQASSFAIIVTSEHNGQRVDKFITEHFTQYSRSFLQKLFSQNQVIINQTKIVKQGYTLKSGDQIFIQFPQESDQTTKKEIKTDFDVQIVAKHDDFLIINKPAGLV